MDSMQLGGINYAPAQDVAPAPSHSQLLHCADSEAIYAVQIVERLESFLDRLRPAPPREVLAGRVGAVSAPVGPAPLSSSLERITCAHQVIFRLMEEIEALV